jgi:multiple sugar transport system substrate-binding protein
MFVRAFSLIPNGGIDWQDQRNMSWEESWMKKTCLVLVLALLATMLGSLPALAESPVTITFMGWEASPLETESVLKGIALFESKNPDIKVEYTPINGTYAEKLLTMIAGDAAPETFFMGMGEYRNFLERALLLDLTTTSSEYKAGDFIQSSRRMSCGHIYGVSSCTSAGHLSTRHFDAAESHYPPRIRPSCGPGTSSFENAKKLPRSMPTHRGHLRRVRRGEHDRAWRCTYARGGKFYNEDHRSRGDNVSSAP